MNEDKIKDNIPDDDKRITHDDMSDTSIRIVSGSMPVNRTPEEEATETPTWYAAPAEPPSPRRQEPPQRKRGMSCIFIIVIAVIALVILFIFFIGKAPVKNADFEHNAEPIEHAPIVVDDSSAMVVTAIDEAPGEKAIITINQDTIDHVILRIYTLHGGKAELHLGPMDPNDKDYLLAVNAADARADKNEPVGMFVLNGSIKAKGDNKNGFCAILDGQVSIGRQGETPLFERVINEGGSFFRQYSIVNRGETVAISPKGKSYRRALCVTEGVVQVIESQNPVSFETFSSALTDLGVKDALALVGGDVFVSCPSDTISRPAGTHFPGESFLIWRP